MLCFISTRNSLQESRNAFQICMPKDGLWVSQAVNHGGILCCGWWLEPDVSCSVQSKGVVRLLSPSKWRLPSLLPSLYLHFDGCRHALICHIGIQLVPRYTYINVLVYIQYNQPICTIGFFLPYWFSLRLSQKDETEDTAKIISKYFDSERKAMGIPRLEPVNIDMG